MDSSLEAIKRAVRARALSDSQVRHAVVSARLAGCSWTDVGAALGISRQAAREKYLGLEQVAKAWSQVERLLGEVARGRQWDRSTGETTKALVTEGALTQVQAEVVWDLLHGYEAAVAGRPVVDEAAEGLTDNAVALIATLHLLSLRGRDT